MFVKPGINNHLFILLNIKNVNQAELTLSFYSSSISLPGVGNFNATILGISSGIPNNFTIGTDQV